MSVKSIEKAIDILSLFSLTNPHWSITEISNSMGIPKATVHGIVRTLIQQGFLIQDAENRKYSLGLRIYELGTILSGTLKINLVGLGPVKHLAQKHSTMVRLGLWDHGSVFVTMNRFSSSDVAQIQLLGPRIPAYCTALGKSILAFLPKEQLQDYLEFIKLSAYTPHTVVNKKDLLLELEDIAKLGHSKDNEEYVSGHCCIGAPIFNRMGNPIAAVSLSVLPPDLIQELPSPLVHDLIETSIEISMSMGYVPAAFSGGMATKMVP